MEKIQNEKTLVEKLKEDIKTSGKSKVLLQAGHFPLMYHKESAREALDQWGVFPKYSLELATQIGDYARNLGKEVKFAFIADDHTYVQMSGFHNENCKRKRKRFYIEKSGVEAKLASEYSLVLELYGFSEEDVLRHDQGKEGRKSSLYFSELALRASNKGVSNACAREYVTLLEDPKYFDKEKTHLISFVPQRCSGHICDVALDYEVKDLSASHIFMETIGYDHVSKEELFTKGMGVNYRKD